MRICDPHFYQGEEKLPLKLLPSSGSTILPYADTYSHYGAKHVPLPVTDVICASVQWCKKYFELYFSKSKKVVNFNSQVEVRFSRLNKL